MCEADYVNGLDHGLQSCVLVVDDEEGIKEEIVDCLQLEGIATRSAHNAERAMAILAEDPSVTVLLTDLHMPGTSGLVLARAARALRPEELALEVVVLTGHANVANALEAGRIGVADFLDKPIQLARLREAVARAHRAAVRRRRAFEEAVPLSRALEEAIETLERALQSYGAHANPPWPSGGAAAACSEVLALTRLLAHSAAFRAEAEAELPSTAVLTIARRLAEHAAAMMTARAHTALAAPAAGRSAAS